MIVKAMNSDRAISRSSHGSTRSDCYLSIEVSSLIVQPLNVTLGSSTLCSSKKVLVTGRPGRAAVSILGANVLVQPVSRGLRRRSRDQLSRSG